MTSRPMLFALCLVCVAGLFLCCALRSVARANEAQFTAAEGVLSPLARTAAAFEEEIFTSHLQDGLVIFQEADPTGKARYTNENAGSATGCLLSALSYKWSVTGAPAARARARQAADGLAMLEQITGVPGLTARQYKMMSGPGDDENSWLAGDWHQGERYRWLGNLSTDEMTWYLTALGDYVMLCAEGEDRRLASGIIRRVVGRMLDHEMRITEADGTTTTWGDCSRATPREPLFCLHGLHYLKVAELCAFEERFADAYEEYASDQEYLDQAVHCYQLGVENHSWADYDPELASPGYELLITFDKDPRRRAALREGLLEMADGRRADVFAHLCTAVVGLDGAEVVRRWLADAPADITTGPVKCSYIWVYWKAVAAGIISQEE